jgi:hypothetical protein
MPLDPSQIAEAKKYKRDRDNAALAESLGHASQFNPTEQRQADILSTEIGAPLDAVSNNLAEATQLQSTTEIDAAELRESHPRVAAWMSDPTRARVSLDDIEAMKNYESSSSPDGVNPIKNSLLNAGEVLDSMTGGFFKLAGQAWKEGEEVLASEYERYAEEKGLDIPLVKLNDLKVFGGRGPADALIETGTAIAEGGLGYEPIHTVDEMLDNPSLAQVGKTALEQGPGAVIQMIAVLGNMPLYTASIAHSIAEDNAANDGREGDATMSDVMDALPYALVSSALERIGGRSALGLLAKKPARFSPRYVVTEPLKASAKEAGTEGLQNPIEYLGGIIGTDAEIEYGEMARQAIGGAVLGGVIGGTTRTASLPMDAFRQRSADTLEKNVTSAIEQQSLDGMIDSIQSMKLFQESPQRAAEFLKDAAADDKLYVTPEEVVAAAEEGLPVPQYMLDAAQDATDVEVSVEQFAMDVISSEELLTRLRPHTKRTPGSFTQSEIKARDNSHLDKLLEDAKQDNEVRTEAESVYDTTVEQLVATGRMSPEAARHSAQIIPAIVTTQVARQRARGIETTVQEVYEKMNFTVEALTRKTRKGTTQKPSDGTRLQQEQQMLEGEALEAVEGTAIADPETGAPIRLYVDPESVTEPTEAQVEPTYLTAVPVQEGAQDSSYVNLTNPQVLSGTTEDMKAVWDENDLQALKDEGYDGIWLQHPDGDRVISFDPGQVQTVPAVELDRETDQVVQQIDQDVSTFEQLLACTKAA